LAALLALALAACRGVPVDNTYPTRTHGDNGTPGDINPNGSIFGKGGITTSLFGHPSANEDSGGGGGIGVNSYLWRASLDTLSFMPLASADPFGGVIITDWYSPSETPDERFKVNVFILGRQLRADGLRAAVFRQKRNADGTWVDAPVESSTKTDLENAILMRARQMRLATAQR
jgi:hypothetical protein